MADKKKKYVASRTRRVQASDLTFDFVQGEPVDVPENLVGEFVTAGYVEEAS